MQQQVVRVEDAHQSLVLHPQGNVAPKVVGEEEDEAGTARTCRNAMKHANHTSLSNHQCVCKENWEGDKEEGEGYRQINERLPAGKNA